MTNYEFSGRGLDSQLTYGVYMIFDDHYGDFGDYKSWNAWKDAQGFKNHRDDDMVEDEVMKKAEYLCTMPSDLWVVIRDAVNWTEIVEALKMNWTAAVELTEDQIQERAFDMFKVHLDEGRREAATYLDECQSDNDWSNEDTAKVREAYVQLLQNAALGK